MFRPFALMSMTLFAAAPVWAEFDPAVIGGGTVCVLPGMMPAIRTTAIEATGWTRLGPDDRADAVALLAAAQSPVIADDQDLPLDAAQARLRQELTAQAQAAPAFDQTDEWFLRTDNGRTHALRFVADANGTRCDIAATTPMSREELASALLVLLEREQTLVGGAMLILSDMGTQGDIGFAVFPDAAAFQAVGLDSPGILIVVRKAGD